MTDPKPNTTRGAARSPEQDAGRDADIRSRLERDPEDVQARLDEALDESMDGSDPVQIVEPSSEHR